MSELAVNKLKPKSSGYKEFAENISFQEHQRILRALLSSFERESKLHGEVMIFLDVKPI